MILRRWRSLKRRTKLTLVGAVLVVCVGSIHAPEPLEIFVYLPNGVYLREPFKANAEYTPNRCIPFLSCEFWIPTGPLTSTPFLSIESAEIEKDHQLDVDIVEGGKAVRLNLPRQYIFSLSNYELAGVRLYNGAYFGDFDEAPNPSKPGTLQWTTVGAFRVVDERASRVAAARVSTRPHIDPSGRMELRILGHEVKKVEGWWPFQRLVLKVEFESEVR